MVELIDPRGDVAPYTRQLASALAGSGIDVRVVTAPFVHGALAPAAGVTVDELFHRLSGRIGKRRVRAFARLVEHPFDALAHRAARRRAALRHYQWLPYEPVDPWLLPSGRPRLLTLHNVLRRSGMLGSKRYLRALGQRFDALVVHTRAGAEVLVRAGVPAERICVHPHPAFTHLRSLAGRAALPAPLASATEAPAVLYFGSVRPYKGLDSLLRAARQLEGCELWVVGRPLVGDLGWARALAREVPVPVRFVDRYVSDTEAATLFARAAVVVLPYRAIDQSGVLALALGLGRAAVATAVGGFRELGEEFGYPALARPGDEDELAERIADVVSHPQRRRELETRAEELAAGPLSFAAVARTLIALYERLGVPSARSVETETEA
ncbi:glycosyltransferase family 4 protein [Thermoleophilum album]|jgi:glycosyltransferase involved in cell wall biosynthesis|uniref:glycosyltransferase family 4 protein n=1 Tax=Thermoleophilum album TaxID=29539 RepID=UPI00237CF531|nr:glycosyltransferase family 4 protein [Thermoleophilum album]WDT93716.1 glycosyltransferase family 4 protein [Thermoleophilum album]